MFEIQRLSGPNYGWITVAERETREEAEEYIQDYDPECLISLRVKLATEEV